MIRGIRNIYLSVRLPNIMQYHKPSQEVQKKIITSLGMKNNQTFTELTKTANISRESALLGLKKLKDVISRDKEKRYHLKSETKNKVLKAFRDFKIIDFDIDSNMQSLRENANPFEVGFILIRYILKCLPSLTLELNSPKLSGFEKIECEELVIRCNEIIRKTFEVLEEIDFENKTKRTLDVKKALDLTNNISVGDEYKIIHWK